MNEPVVQKNSSAQSLSINIKSLLPDLKSHLIFWPLAIGGLVLDLWSKNAVFSWLDDHEYYVVIDGFLNLTRALNDGAAWSIFSGKSLLLVSVASIALIGIIIFFLLSGKQPRIIHAAMGLFTAGIAGNLHDRYYNNGLVRDFIDIHIRNNHWPTFNIADSLLCIGVGLLIISSFIAEKPAQKHDPRQKSEQK